MMRITELNNYQKEQVRGAAEMLEYMYLEYLNGDLPDHKDGKPHAISVEVELVRSRGE